MGDQRGAERGEEQAGRAVVHALPADPEPPPARGRRRSRDYRVSMASRSSNSMIVSIRSIRKCSFAPVLLAVALGLAGVRRRRRGRAARRHRAAARRRPPRPATETQPETETTSLGSRRPRRCPTTATATGPPEGGTGGAGDEEPARTLALFTGENGRITPPRDPRAGVHLDPRGAALRRRRRVRADVRRARRSRSGGELSSASTTFDGLRPGAKLVGTATGARGKCVIEATAEPGPVD